MNIINYSAEQFPKNELNRYIEMGNDAIRTGNETECMMWYSKGLSIARELKDQEKERLLSNLIITLI